MADYIEREAALAAIRERCAPCGEGIEALKSVPAADAAPVRYGKWEWREEWDIHPETHSCDLLSCGWYCTGCGIELGEYLSKKTNHYICLDDDYCEPNLTFCPNCGAKMDLEDNQ